MCACNIRQLGTCPACLISMLWRNTWAHEGSSRAREPMLAQSRGTSLIGAAIGLGAKDNRCEHGPAALTASGLVDRLQQQLPASEWVATLHARSGGRGQDVLPSITSFCGRLADATREVVRAENCAWVLGGDHSCAIGTWAGIAAAQDGPLGLIWVDAHMDSHTPETSPSGAVHGMPLACLLGIGAPSLVRLGGYAPKLLPENVCVVGVRSFEPAEANLLQRLGVHVFSMDEIRRRGMTAVLAEATARVRMHTTAFGITIDLDAIDPGDAPGVGSPEPGGIAGEDLVAALAHLSRYDELVGVEIAEFNPDRDVDGVTAVLIYELLASIAGKRGAS
jgi:arginase